jgi:hypothetical protein
LTSSIVRYTFWIGITQVMVCAFAITIRMFHILSVAWILYKPFIIAFCISNEEMYPYLHMNVTA